MSDSTDFNLEEMKRVTTIDGWNHTAACHANYYLTLINKGVPSSPALQMSLNYQALVVQMYLEERYNRNDE